MLASQMQERHYPTVGALIPASGRGSEEPATISVLVDKDNWATSDLRMRNWLDTTFSAVGAEPVPLPVCNPVAVSGTMRGQSEREAMADAIAQVTGTTRGDWLGSGARLLDSAQLTESDRQNLISLAHQKFEQNVLAERGSDVYVAVNGRFVNIPPGCDS